MRRICSIPAGLAALAPAGSGPLALDSILLRATDKSRGAREPIV
jgi:hypothetical protein